MRSTTNSELTLGAKPNQFPRDCVQGVARKFADTFSSHLESPWVFWVFAFLTFLGNILADLVSADIQTDPQPRLFTILMGESSRTRKSTCISETIKLFIKALGKILSICRGVGSAEGLAQYLQANPKTILILDEFKVFVNKAAIHGSILLPCVNSLFEENTFQSSTKTSPLKVGPAFLSLLSASTTETFQKMWKPAFVDIGFINRLWLVPGTSERKFAAPKRIPRASLKQLRVAVRSLVQKAGRRKTILSLTPKARRVFDKWYEKTPETVFSDRLDTYAHRLMILFCVNEGKKRIDSDVVKRVIKLLEWQLKVREENQPIDAENTVARLEQAIRRALTSTPLKKRDLQRKVHYDRPGIWAWNRAVENLLKAKEVSWDRKTDVYELCHQTCHQS